MTPGFRLGPMLLPLVVALAACEERETQVQLQAWVDMVRNNTTATQPQFVAAPAFIPLSYDAETGSAPFGRPQNAGSDLPRARPQQRGKAQPLEDFPLESIQMVGTISQEGRRHALLQADRIVYQAKPGDYAGKNFGVIRRIADDEIELEELLPAAEGGWTIRQAKLALRGGKQ